MDKYKTIQMGQALKKVYRSEITIDDSVHLAEKEIGEVFENSKDAEPEKDTNIGIFGEVVCKCPLCEKDVIRTKFGYGCTGYKDGCKFTVNKSICKRVISLSNVKMLLATGKTLTGIGILILFAVCYIVRQLAEPKILSKQMNVHPLITIFAMYAGFKITGIAGLILAPFLTFVIKTICVSIKKEKTVENQVKL
jgi:hypothetical protein